MRTLPTALLLSAAVHGGLVGWVATRSTADNLAISRPTPRVEIVDITAVEPPEPMTVALVGDTPAPIAPAASPERIAATETHASRPETAKPANAGETAGGSGATEPTGQPGHSSMMAMRPAKRPELVGPSGDFIDRFLSKHVEVVPNPIAGEARQDQIDELEHNLKDESWARHATPDQITAAREQLVALREQQADAELQHDGTGYKSVHETFVGNVDADGTPHIKDRPNVQVSGAGIKFDATDALMRAVGQDPYSSAKRKYLDDTRDERYEIGKRYKRQQLTHSAVLAKQAVDDLWRVVKDTPGRKAALFELWDDCAETGDDELVEGGRAARRFIVGFIRAHVTGADAFTAAELAKLNAHKQSTATFAPYDTTGAEGSGDGSGSGSADIAPPQ